MLRGVFFFTRLGHQSAFFLKYILNYTVRLQSAEQELMDGRFDTTDDFTLVIQPFFEEINEPPMTVSVDSVIRLSLRRALFKKQLSFCSLAIAILFPGLSA